MTSRVLRKKTPALPARAIVAAAVAALLLGLSGALAAQATRPVAPASGPAVEERLRAAFGETWYGVYVEGRRCGWARTLLRRVPESGEIELETRMGAKFTIAGTRNEILRVENRHYAAAPPHALISGTDATTLGGNTEVLQVMRGADGRYTVTVFAGDRTQSLGGIESEETLADQLGPAWFATTAPNPGDAAAYRVFVIESGADADISVTAIKSEDFAAPGGTIKALRMKTTNSRTNLDEEVVADTKGRMLRRTMGPRFEYRIEEAARAADIDFTGDLMLSLFVPVTGFTGEPSGIDQLSVKLLGRTAPIPDREGQASEKLAADTSLVTIRQLPPPSDEDRKRPMPAAAARWVKPDPLVPSGDDGVRRLAGEICGRVTDPWARVVAVVDWISRNILKTYDMNSDTALTVMRSRSGDCTESSRLATALLRAAGVPARELCGLLLMNTNRHPGFLHHAWVEVWVGRWIPVDPSFGQAPADAAHLALGHRADLSFVTSLTELRAEVVPATQPNR